MKRATHSSDSSVRQAFRTGIYSLAAVAGLSLLIAPLVLLQSFKNYEAGRGALASEKLLIRRAEDASYRLQAAMVAGLWRAFATPHADSSATVRASLRPGGCVNWPQSGAATSVIANASSSVINASSSAGPDNLQQTAGMNQLNTGMRISWQAPCGPAPAIYPTVASRSLMHAPALHGNGPATGAAKASQSVQAVNIQVATPTPGSNSLTVVRQLQSLRDRADCSKGVLLNVIAHQDDDLLFMNPDLAQAIRAGKCVRTTYLTAGDSGQSTEYWMGRETGAKQAYARMANVPNTWQDGRQMIAGQPVEVATLNGAPNVALVFMRLPDGNLHGDGFTATQNQSLAELLQGSLPDMQSVDSKTSYTKDGLVNTLQAILSTDRPDAVHTLGLAATADGDHSDHIAAGTLTLLAAQKYSHVATLTEYGGYPDKLLLPNVAPDDVALKQDIFFAYGTFDNAVCQNADACAETDTYSNYLTREYKADVPVAPTVAAAP